MQDRERKNQFDYIPHMHGRGWCAAILHLPAHHAEIVRRDLRQKPISKRWQDVALVDRAPHGTRAVGHARLLEPLLAKRAELLRLLQSSFFVLLLLSGRPSFRNGPLRIDQLLASPGKREASWAVSAERQRLATSVEAVVVPEHDRPCRLHHDIHTVTIARLVQFLL